MQQVSRENAQQIADNLGTTPFQSLAKLRVSAGQQTTHHVEDME